MSIAPNATEERPQALGRVFRHEFARALAYLRLGAIPAYIVAYFGIRRVFRVTGPFWSSSLLEEFVRGAQVRIISCRFMLLAAVCLTLAVLGATVVVSLTIKPFQKLCRA